MSQTSYRAALPHDMHLLYSRKGILSMLFIEQFAGGKFNAIGVAVLWVWSAGDFDGCVMVADGE